MIARIYILFLVCCIIYVALISFMRVSISSERRHLSITDLTARAQKNSSCVLGMTISDSDKKLWLNHPFGGFSWVVVLICSVLGSFSWGSRSGLLDCIIYLIRTHRVTTMILLPFFLHWRSVNMCSIVLGVSVQDPRDCGLRYWSLYQIFIFLGYWFFWWGYLYLLNSSQRASSCT